MTKYLTILLAASLLFSSCKLFKKDRQETVEVPAPVPPDEPKEIVVIDAPDPVDDTVPYVEDLKEKMKKASFSLSYERTPCFGRCPVFTFSIDSDGSCLYHGKNFVDNIGWYEGKLDESQLLAIYTIIEEISYFELEDKYDALISDLPATITNVTIGEKTKRVYDRYHGPDNLQDLYEELDLMIANVELKASSEQKQ